MLYIIAAIICIILFIILFWCIYYIEGSIIKLRQDTIVNIKKLDTKIILLSTKVNVNPAELFPTK